MKLETLVAFFKHVAAREVSHGLEEAFRFGSVLSSRKNGSLQNAQYENTGIDAEDEAGAGAVGPQGKAATAHKRRKGKGNNIEGDGAVPRTACADGAGGRTEKGTGNTEEVNQVLQQAQYSFITFGSSTGIQNDHLVPNPQNRLVSMDQEVFYDRGLISLGLVQPTLIGASEVRDTTTMTPASPSSFALDPKLIGLLPSPAMALALSVPDTGPANTTVNNTQLACSQPAANLQPAHSLVSTRTAITLTANKYPIKGLPNSNPGPANTTVNNTRLACSQPAANLQPAHSLVSTRTAITPTAIAPTANKYPIKGLPNSNPGNDDSFALEPKPSANTISKNTRSAKKLQTAHTSATTPTANDVSNGSALTRSVDDNTRRKSRSSQSLALLEAKKFGVSGKRRR